MLSAQLRADEAYPSAAPSAIIAFWSVRLLEQDLGVRLFIRSTRGMTLTAPAHRVLELAANTHQRAAGLRSEPDADRHPVRGHVIITTVEGPLSRCIPSTIEALATTHPGIRIDVHVAGSHDVCGMRGWLIVSWSSSSASVRQCVRLNRQKVLRERAVRPCRGVPTRCTERV